MVLQLSISYLQIHTNTVWNTAQIHTLCDKTNLNICFYIITDFHIISLKKGGSSKAIKRKKYCFESYTNSGVGCHNQSCVSLICLVYLDMMQRLVQNEKPSNRPTCKCLKGELRGLREEKMAKPYVLFMSTAGNKSGIFPQACSSHVKAILITVLPVTLLTLDCRSLNYIWARIPPFHSGLLNAWTGIDLVFDAVSDWFLWLGAQETASPAEVKKGGGFKHAPST